MGGSDWWLGRGGRAAEPASGRAEGAAKFPGEGARSAPELARDPPPPTALTTGGGRLRSQRLESNVIYLFAGVQPLGLDPIDTPLDFGSPRPTSPAPQSAGVGSSQEYTRRRPPRPLPAPRHAEGVGPRPGSGKSSKAGAGEGRGAGGWGRP